MSSIWIISAFIAGLAARGIKMPPMIGYLFIGFLLNGIGIPEAPFLDVLSAVGIKLLLFTIGLKLNVKILFKREIVATYALYTILVMLFLTTLLSLLSALVLSQYFHLTLQQAVLVAFALSFSSTVCAIQILEERGEISTRHSSIAIGILIFEDIAVVIFLTVVSNKLPSIWALGLLLIPFTKKLLGYVLDKVGHEELLCLYGFFLTFVSAALFEKAGIKAELGPLVVGALFADHAKNSELYKSLLRFKELFLIGFYISIGYAAHLSIELLLVSGVIIALVFVKSLLLTGLLLFFRIRAHTAFLVAGSLLHYSEFGLIVGAYAVEFNLIKSQWLVIIAISVAGSFFISVLINNYIYRVFDKVKPLLLSLEKKAILPEDVHHQIGKVDIVLIGTGKIGDKVYKSLSQKFDGSIMAIDQDPKKVQIQLQKSRRAITADGANAQFWDSQKFLEFKMVLLAVSHVHDSLEIQRQLLAKGYTGKIAAISMHIDEAEILREAGIHFVFNYHSELGAGYANNVLNILGEPEPA